MRLAGLMFAALAGLPFLLSEYGTLLATRMIFLGLLAVSVALMTGVAGLPTLGQTAPFAVGGIWLWYFFGELMKRPLLPINDPYLENAIEHGKGH